MSPQLYHGSRYKTPSLCRWAGWLWPAAIGCLCHVWIRPCSVWIWWGRRVRWGWKLHCFQSSHFCWKEVEKTRNFCNFGFISIEDSSRKARIQIECNVELVLRLLWSDCLLRTHGSAVMAANDDVLRSTKLYFIHSHNMTKSDRYWPITGRAQDTKHLIALFIMNMV